MHTTRDHLYLSDETLAALDIPLPSIADAIEAALHQKAGDTLVTAPKSALLPGGGRYMMTTLAVGDYTVVKTAAVSPDNPSRDLPAINGAILILDAETGLLRAVLDANWITAVRTAALSVVAARRLADPAASTLALIGTGVQASSHLAAFAAEFPLTTIYAYGRGRANTDRLCREAQAMGLTAHAPDSAEQALTGADIVVTSVTLNYEIKPFLEVGWLTPGAFAAITDLAIPWHDAGLAAFAPLVVDDRAQEAESPRPMVPANAITHDLTELVTGPAPSRPTHSPTAFAFRGMALGDYAAAALAYETAVAHAAGQRIVP
ncbi:MAG: ornithine cyclodeaminase family protein [Pseudomonadota bacterium]